MNEIQLLKYYTKSGKCPFEDWYKSIKDKKAKANIDARFTRLRTGNFGNYKDLGNGLKELKIPYGPGYRVYFFEVLNIAVLLLLGGDKGSQRRDIKRAKDFLKDFIRRQKDG